jgi:Fumarylacetoacetate (FAA) hydrolase family
MTETKSMRMASWRWGGRDHVGTPSPDGREATPLAVPDASRGITLYPGDVIATGTPAGVGMGLKPPQWLKAGDVVRIEIDGVGVIENRFE